MLLVIIYVSKRLRNIDELVCDFYGLMPFHSLLLAFKNCFIEYTTNEKAQSSYTYCNEA